MDSATVISILGPIILGLVFLWGMIYFTLKLLEAVGGLCNAYGAMIEDAAGIRRYRPQKRPMSDNNTTTIPTDPHYK